VLVGGNSSSCSSCCRCCGANSSRLCITVAPTLDIHAVVVLTLVSRSYALIHTLKRNQVAHKEQLAAVAMAAREVALKNGRNDHERIVALEQQSQQLQSQLRTAEQRCDDLRDQVSA
jgi:hypothetical protein